MSTDAHSYLSTGCLHGSALLPDGRTGHEYCQSETGVTGAKEPACCKVCGVPCYCPCHHGAANPNPLPPHLADLTEARRALDISLATLIHVGEYLRLQAQASHILSGPGDGSPAPTGPLHEAVTTALKLAHNTLDSTDPTVPEHPTARCVQCGSAKVTYFNHAEQPFCTVCADGRGPQPGVMPHSPPGAASTSPHPRCERCQMPHDPAPGGLPAQVCGQFFAEPGTPVRFAPTGAAR